VSNTARLGLWLVDADDDELAELTEILRNAGADDAKRPLLPDSRPGYRGAEDTIADVVATLEPTVSLIGRVVNALRTWLGARPQRVIEIKLGEDSIKINGFSTDTEDRLVEAFVQRVTGGK
jgi:hypothetical protein